MTYFTLYVDSSFHGSIDNICKDLPFIFFHTVYFNIHLLSQLKNWEGKLFEECEPVILSGIQKRKLLYKTFRHFRLRDQGDMNIGNDFNSHKNYQIII